MGRSGWTGPLARDGSRGGFFCLPVLDPGASGDGVKRMVMVEVLGGLVVASVSLLGVVARADVFVVRVG